ncbi:MAG: hypothetical protein IOD12_10455 [Silvanigrellales bacterium]|jgi:hypothetical protein|nr:hypothetical protein [Silvanigrellales bacterium]
MQVPENAQPRTYAQSPDGGDEIDLVELLGFLLRIRNFVALGLVLGLLAGAAAVFLFSKPSYSTRLSVTVDPASLPAISDVKKLQEAHQGALGSPELVGVAFKRILEQAPELAQRLQARGISLNGLVTTQTLSERPALLKVSSQVSSQDFLLEASLPEAGMGKEAGRVLLDAFNEMAAEHNTRAVSILQESSKNLVRQATKAVQEAESNNGQVQSQHQAEFTRIRSDLARLEYRLTRRAGGSSELLRFIETRRDPPQTVRLVNGRDDGQRTVDTQVPNLDVDRVLRLAGALEEERKLSKEEAEVIRKDLANLQLSYIKNESLYSSVISANNAVMTSLYDSMAKAVVPVDRTQIFLPLFKLNEQLYRDDMERGVYERPAGRRWPLLLVAGVVGLVLGGFVGAAREFMRKNGSKFRELSRDS